jgi:Ulp1 family protease
MSGRPLLCYHTANIYDGDLQTLKPGVWLNDNIIAFYMESVRGANRVVAA